MEDQVEIPIVTTADTKGATQTAAALQQVEKATKGSGEASQEAGKKSEFLGLKHGELKKTVRELGREFPLAGQAAKLMMNPLTAGLAFAIGLFAKAKQALAEWNALMDDAAKLAADPTFATGIAAQRAALHAGAVEQAKFAEGARQIMSAQEGVIAKLAETTSKIKEYAAAQAEINNAAEARELAQINLREKTGKLGPDQAIISRAEVRERYSKANDTLKSQAEFQEVAAKQAALAKAEADQPGLDEIAKSKTALVTKMKGQVDKAREQSKATEASAKGYEEQVKKLEAEMQENHLQVLGVPITPAGWMDFAKEIAQAKEQVLQQRTASKKLAAFADQGDVDLEFASGAKNAAVSAANANRQAIPDLTKQIREQRAANSFNQKTRGMVSGLKADESDADTFSQLASTDIGKMLTEGSHTAHLLLAGKMAQDAKASGRPLAGGDQMIKAAQGVSDSQKDLANMLAQNFKTGNQTLEQALKTVEASTSTLQKFERRFADLERKIGNVDAKQKNIGPR